MNINDANDKINKKMNPTYEDLLKLNQQQHDELLKLRSRNISLGQEIDNTKKDMKNMIAETVKNEKIEREIYNLESFVESENEKINDLKDQLKQAKIRKKKYKDQIDILESMIEESPL